MNKYSILPQDEAQRQHQRLSGARARLLRAADLRRRQRILELGAGWGFAATELADRSGQQVTAVDTDKNCSDFIHHQFAEQVVAVQADVHAIPSTLGTFDLVFAQFAFLWFGELDRVVKTVERLLAPHGVLAVIEPDFGGLLAWPNVVDVREIWIDALLRAAAEPEVGRKLNAALESAGWTTQIMLCDRLEPFDPGALDALRELPITEKQREQIDQFCAAERPLCHLPLFMLIAHRETH